MIGMQQLWDEFERNRLSRETKRGMREASEQGYRAGGRAPYGYRRRPPRAPRRPPRRPRQAPRHTGARARRGRRSSPRSSSLRRRQAHPEGDRRAPEPPRRASPPLPRRLGPQRPRPLGGLDDPRDAQKPRLHRPHRSGTGSTSPRPSTHGGGARRRAREEWVVAEEAHLPLVSDETYEAAQARFEKTVRAPPRRGRSAPTCSRGWCAAARATSRCR